MNATGVHLLKAGIVLQCQCHANLNCHNIGLFGGSDPLTHGVVPVCGAVPATSLCLVPRGVCQDVFGVVCRVQHLNNFKKNLDHMLVAVHLGARLRVKGQEEDVHFLQNALDDVTNF